MTRVLVVDDERFFREAISDVLEAGGVPFALAETGEEALARARDPEVGVLVLDLQLPDLHGLEVFRRLAEERPELKVVILSAHTDQEHVLEALRLGAFDYLAKPLHEEELLLAVRRARETYEVSTGWARLRARLAHLERTLGRLAEQSRDGSVSLPDAALAAVEEVLGTRRTSLLRLAEDEGALRVSAVRGHEAKPEELEAVAVGEGPAGWALARSEALLVTDAAADERFAGRAPAGRYRDASFAVAPVVAAGRPLGVLCATECADGRPLGEEDLSLLRILAAQVGELLARPEAGQTGAEAASDGDTTQELLVPTAPADAELVREICEAVTAEVEPERILDAALRPIAERLEAAPVSIFLADPGGGDLRREAERDRGERSDREHLPRTRGLTGFVFETGQLVAAPEPESDPRFDPEADTPADGRPGPLLCAPLRFRGRSLGVLRAFPARAEDASPEVGQLLAAALSAALRSALLYRSLVDSIEDVARARRGSR